MLTDEQLTALRGAPAPAGVSILCRLLYERHLVGGTGGNVAARCGGEILVTPTDVSLRDVLPERLVRIRDGKVPEEGERPSKELSMHLAILEARADIEVVCHIHGSWIVAASCLFEPGDSTIPALAPGFEYFAYPLPMLEYMVPGTEELSRAAAEAFSVEGRRAVLLQNHGLITVGSSLTEVINIAEEVDEAAMIHLLTQGRASAIPDDKHARKH